MAEDHLTVHLAHFSPIINIDNPDAIHPVGLSHLDEYLKIMLGEDVPQSPEVKRLAGSLLGSMAVLSTDEVIYDQTTDESRRLGLMLGMVEPILDGSKRASRFIDKTTGYNGREFKNPEGFLNQDILYLFGIFDLSTFMLAITLEIEHPRHKHTDLSERSRSVVTADTPFSADIENFHAAFIGLFAAAGLLRPDTARNFYKLRDKAEILIADSERQVAQAMQTMNDSDEQDKL